METLAEATHSSMLLDDISLEHYDTTFSPSLTPLSKLTVDSSAFGLADMLEDEVDFTEFSEQVPQHQQNSIEFPELESNVLDIAPSLPVIELLLEESLHELFYASSDAYKAARQAAQQQSLVYTSVLFAEQESLLEEPLTVVFRRLRTDLLEPRYGADAEHYEMGLMFKGLDSLCLFEHEGAASGCSLSNLVQLYTDIADGSLQQTTGLEPFRIELTLQETFTSHLSRLKSQVQPQNITIIKAQQGTLSVETGDIDGNDSIPSVHRAQEVSQEEAREEALEESLQSTWDSSELAMTGEEAEALVDALESDLETAARVEEGNSDFTEATGSSSELPAGTDVFDLDVDSLACIDENGTFDDSLADELDPHSSLRLDIAAYVSSSPTRRSPKRTLEELVDLIDDDFVNEMSPDREEPKKARHDF